MNKTQLFKHQKNLGRKMALKFDQLERVWHLCSFWPNAVLKRGCKRKRIDAWVPLFTVSRDSLFSQNFFKKGQIL